jgi:tripartite-type tricarboxylate transporter receptor subunit TctC
MKALVFFAAAAFLGLANMASRASADTHDFYKGKRIRIIVGLAPGGGFDLYARMVARHLSKHVPGNPNAIVQNMPGAAGTVAANYVYNMGEPDVTILHFGGTQILNHVLGDPTAKFDGRRFGYLGAPTANSVICFVREGSAIRTMEQWIASKQPLILGGVGRGSPTDDIPRFFQETMGLQSQVVSGYGGTSQVRAAIERGEVNGGCWDWGSLRVTSREQFESGKLIPIVHAGSERHRELKQVPVAIDYAKTAEARELLTFVAHAYNTVRRIFVVPPDTSPKRLQVLQKAFIDTLNDPALRAEAERSKMEIDPIDGPTMTRLIGDLYKLSPKAKATVKGIVLP